MNDSRYKEEKIELAPPSPKLQKDTVSQWMEWRVAVQRMPSLDELNRLEKSWVRQGMSVQFSQVDSTNMRVEVKQSPIGDYTE